jgi:hypothetical protein
MGRKTGEKCHLTHLCSLHAVEPHVTETRLEPTVEDLAAEAGLAGRAPLGAPVGECGAVPQGGWAGAGVRRRRRPRWRPVRLAWQGEVLAEPVGADPREPGAGTRILLTWLAVRRTEARIGNLRRPQLQRRFRTEPWVTVHVHLHLALVERRQLRNEERILLGDVDPHELLFRDVGVAVRVREDHVDDASHAAEPRGPHLDGGQ